MQIMIVWIIWNGVQVIGSSILVVVLEELLVDVFDKFSIFNELIKSSGKQPEFFMKETYIEIQIK